jgi:uncharacterized membrane protein
MAQNIQEEVKNAVTEAAEAQGVQKKKRPWLTIVLGVTYPGLLMALVFLPGGTLLDRLRWLDSGICAQLPTHSFYPGGLELPLCARNTGIYLGFMVTLMTLYAMGKGRVQQLPLRPIIVLLVCGGLAMVVDGFNSFFLDLGLPHLYQPHNLLRLATGLAAGLALATLTLPVINRLLWCEYNDERSIPSWIALLLLIPGLILSFFAVASQNALLLYPLALFSTAGLLTVLSSVNLLVVLAIGRHEQTFGGYRELLPFLGLALILAIGELLGLAQLKFSLLQALGI